MAGCVRHEVETTFWSIVGGAGNGESYGRLLDNSVADLKVVFEILGNGLDDFFVFFELF